MTLAELGEFGLIERIRSLAGEAPEETLGIGDDCAAWSVPAGRQLLVTSDLLLEGTHFRLDWTDPYRLGRKAVAVNLSDIAAMGGTPGQLVLGLGLPNGMALTAVDELLEGFLAAANDYGVRLVGGDICRSQQFLTIAVTAFGTIATGRAVRRDTGRPGDLLFVSGTVGDSALALQQLQGGGEVDACLARRHFDPVPRLALGRALAERELATAMLDLSDGLASDLPHLLSDRVGGALVYEARIPVSRPFAAALDDPDRRLRLAVGGGEDYELLFSAAPENRQRLRRLGEEFGLELAEIGMLTAELEGCWLERPAGARIPLAGETFSHFCNDSGG